MIKTQITDPNPLDFFKLLLSQRLLNKWYGFLFPLVAALAIHFTAYDEDGLLVKFLLVFSALYPAWVIGYYYWYAHSEKNLAALKARVYEIGSSTLSIKVDDESVGEIQLNKTNKVVEAKNYLAIYQSNGQFLFIPKASFSSSEDVNSAKEILGRNCKSYQPK